jgi:hypothetical protein
MSVRCVVVWLPDVRQLNLEKCAKETMFSVLYGHRPQYPRWPIPVFAVSLGALTMACGGRTRVNLQATPMTDQTPLLEDAGNEGQTQNGKAPDSAAPVLDASAEQGFDGGSPSFSLDDGGAASATPFAMACETYASAIGKLSCEGCISTANGACNALWSELRDQCGVGYACGITCGCTAPCNTAGLCSCVAGCLPVEDNPCTRLWSEVMQCIGSACAGHC